MEGKPLSPGRRHRWLKVVAALDGESPVRDMQEQSVSRVRHMAVALVLVAGAVADAQAQTRPADLALASLEDLMDIEISSVSRKDQRLGDVPAAISVITQDDIRRSGMTTLPELLRLVPGVQVAQINSNKWAIAVRGFNNLFADKVLVLIDGRTVYDRLNSGIFWESLNITLDLIERIEVIRLEVPLTGRLTASIVGQNLLHASHAEHAGTGAIVTPTLIPRSARLQLMWQF